MYNGTVVMYVRQFCNKKVYVFHIFINIKAYTISEVVEVELIGPPTTISRIGY